MDPLLLIPILFAVGIVGALATFPWRNRERRQGWLWVFAALLPPVANLMWGRLFLTMPGGLPSPTTSMAENVLIAFLLASIGLTFVLPLMMKARFFGMFFAVAMLGVTLGTGLLAAMQVSGTWI